jgi:hypothetical protein
MERTNRRKEKRSAGLESLYFEERKERQGKLWHK